jgi:large subunit ribosomal protein L10
VTKNTLFTKVLQDNGWAVPDDLLNGPVAIAFGMENFPGVAKAVLDYTTQKEFEEKFNIRGGVMGSDIVTAQGIDTISKLPTLDELRSQLAGLMVTPAQGLVNVIYAATGQVVNVLQAYLDDREKGEDVA